MTKQNMYIEQSFSISPCAGSSSSRDFRGSAAMAFLGRNEDDVFISND